MAGHAIAPLLPVFRPKFSVDATTDVRRWIWRKGIFAACDHSRTLQKIPRRLRPIHGVCIGPSHIEGNAFPRTSTGPPFAATHCGLSYTYSYTYTYTKGARVRVRVRVRVRNHSEKRSEEQYRSDHRRGSKNGKRRTWAKRRNIGNPCLPYIKTKFRFHFSTRKNQWSER